ncbi:MAG: DUF5615 family PIN-like protein [Nitrososphaerales archaeon]
MPRSTVKFLADENIPTKTVDHLVENGIDIIPIKNFGYGLDDDEILKLAYRQRRVIITFDKEFGYLVFRKKIKTFGVLLLRFVPESPEEVSRRIIELINNKVKFPRNFIVLEEEKMRVRSID